MAEDPEFSFEGGEVETFQPNALVGADGMGRQLCYLSPGQVKWVLGVQKKIISDHRARGVDPPTKRILRRPTRRWKDDPALVISRNDRPFFLYYVAEDMFRPLLFRYRKHGDSSAAVRACPSGQSCSHGGSIPLMP